MLKVGLTGGIGSGKTLIGKVFMQLGIPVFNADGEAKKILNSNSELVEKIKNTFGEGIYSNNTINKKKLAAIIFNDNSALQKVNSIIHPKVRENFHKWIEEHAKARYVIEEAAILFESKAYKELDFTINVHADKLIRTNRVVNRDNTTAKAVESRMNNQLSDNERMKLADFTIYNDGELMVLPQVLEIHSQILKQRE